MIHDLESRPWETLERLAQRGDADQLEQFIDTLSPGEAARAIARLDSELQDQVLTVLDREDAADLVEDIPDAQGADLLEHLPPAVAAEILGEMRSDEQADMLAELEPPAAEAILAAMSDEDAAEVRELAAHDPESAGGLMITEFLSYAETATVRDVLNDLTAHAEEYSEYDAQYLYVVTSQRKLVGVVGLRDLLFSPPNTPLAQIMSRDPVSVNSRTMLDELHDLFEQRHFYGVPVSDSLGRLVGVVLDDAVDRALAERADSDHLKSQGIVGGDELRTMPIWLRSRRRLSWLSVNIGLNIIAASVIAFFQQTLSEVLALAVFLPIISDMSGCSGNQAIAVSMRELSLGLVKPFETLRVWLHELSVGLINGVALGLLIAIVAWVWQGNAVLGLVVGVALAANTVLAVSIGGVVPLLLKRLDKDPALASGPILTTITDMFGFFLVLGLATLMLPWLTKA